ncbi:MAG TPA: hypothetical protein ENJ35_06995 [Gammaproteobacteria bacterium]|nr:hypothetical protein [Gammaproteobacteria bacterium]
MRADAQKALVDLLDIDLDACTIQLCLASLLEDDVPEFQKVTVSKEIAQEFQSIVTSFVAKWNRDTEKGDLILHQYDAMSKLDRHEIEYLKLDDHDSIMEQVESLSSPAQLEVFKEDDEFVKGLRF